MTVSLFLNRITDIQPTEITQSVQTPNKPLQPKSTEAICNTRSGRAGKMPTKYSDYVCNFWPRHSHIFQDDKYFVDW
jgi:hypothetical protein